MVLHFLHYIYSRKDVGFNEEAFLSTTTPMPHPFFWCFTQVLSYLEAQQFQTNPNSPASLWRGQSLVAMATGLWASQLHVLV